MSRIFALIEGNLVSNTAVAGDPPDERWLADAEAAYSSVIDVTDLDPQPCRGWTYDGTTFTPPEND